MSGMSRAATTQPQSQKSRSDTQQAGVQKTRKPAQKKKSSEKKSQPIKLPANAYALDRIEAVIFGSEVTDLVTLSDIQRVGFDGKFHTKDDVITERLMFQDALKYRITMDEKAVDEYMLKVAKNMGGTIDDIKDMFLQSGYTYEEGRRQFAIMYANSQLIDHKIRSRLVVPERLVVEYYEAHPVITQASYMLERAFVPATPQALDEVRKKIDTFVKTGKGLVVTWYALPEISQEDLADDKKFIMQLKGGEVSTPLEVKGGFELFRLKSKKSAHVVPIEERYRDIVELLRRPKFEEMLTDYKKELLGAASILYV